MTIKHWLLRGNELQREIDDLREAERQARSRATSITAEMHEPVAHSSATQMDGRLIEYADGDYFARIRAKIAEYTAVLDEIAQVIYAVDESVLRRVLINRYIIGKKWEQIALDMDYSYSNVTHNLHPKALRAAEKAKECIEVHKVLW